MSASLNGGGVSNVGIKKSSALTVVTPLFDLASIIGDTDRTNLGKINLENAKIV